MTPILSICIPTYNRAGYLYFTLKSIIEQEIFKNTYDIEIVISDNCSTDATAKIVEIFKAQYPDKIVYNRNEVNITDKNFEKVLECANGEVLKLHNDNFLINDGSLDSVVEKIKQYRNEKPMFFFANHNSPLGESKLCENMSEFTQAASYLTTWIAAFSIWKEDFENFEDFSKNVQSMLMQTDVLYRFVAKGKKIYVINDEIFYGQSVLVKRGYNTAKIFGQNYLGILKQYLKTNILDKKIYEDEKKHLLLNHVIPISFSTTNGEKVPAMKNGGFWKYLFKDYWYNFYFYTSIIKIFRRVLDVELNLIGRKLNPNSYQKYWRKRNRHNDTTICKNVDQTKVFVGKNAKGHIDVEFSSNPNELLIIDDNMVIEEGTKFNFEKSELIIVSDFNQSSLIKKALI